MGRSGYDTTGVPKLNDASTENVVASNDVAKKPQSSISNSRSGQVEYSLARAEPDLSQGKGPGHTVPIKTTEAKPRRGKKGARNVGGVKKPHRYKPEVVRAFNTEEVISTKKSFQHLVQEVAQDFKADLRFQAGALGALQEAAEAFLVGFSIVSVDLIVQILGSFTNGVQQTPTGPQSMQSGLRSRQRTCTLLGNRGRNSLGLIIEM
ncbi:MAG: hypothetical protein M1816_005330 [Peltula sp. TS41687]|nr:MAG: hypothetical protein M1816_005330 [Peltula sp. TS41687]